MSNNKRKDLTGQRYGKLLIISMADDYISPSGHRLARCKCKCDCGVIKNINMSQIITGKTQSCGCLIKTAGLLKDKSELLEKYEYKLNSDLEFIATTFNNRQLYDLVQMCIQYTYDEVLDAIILFDSERFESEYDAVDKYCGYIRNIIKRERNFRERVA